MNLLCLFCLLTCICSLFYKTGTFTTVLKLCYNAPQAGARCHTENKNHKLINISLANVHLIYPLKATIRSQHLIS